MNKFEMISIDQWKKDIPELEYPDIFKSPARATTDSCGYDIYALDTIHIEPHQTVKVPTGLRVILDPDRWLMIVPRSGLGFKYGLRLSNTVGVIDADYYKAENEGHFWVKMTNPSDAHFIIEKGQAFCQAILMPLLKMDEDTVIDIPRKGGFGSTTK